MNNSKSWHVLYTKPNYEKKICDYLNRKKINSYCPLNRMVKEGKTRTTEQPLFTSYVFVNANDADLLTIKQLDGVVNIVYWLGKPAVIQPSEILAIQEFLKSYSNVELERISVSVHDSAYATNNQLHALDENNLAKNKKGVKLLLPSLGYAMLASVDVAFSQLFSKDSLLVTPSLNYNNSYNGIYR